MTDLERWMSETYRLTPGHTHAGPCSCRPAPDLDLGEIRPWHDSAGRDVITAELAPGTDVVALFYALAPRQQSAGITITATDLPDGGILLLFTRTGEQADNHAMSDDTYPSEWLDHAPPLQEDPEPAPWQGPASLYARCLELLELRCTNSPGYETAMLNMALDVYADLSVPQLINAFCGLHAASAFGSAGMDVTIARLRADLADAREIAAKEAQQ